MFIDRASLKVPHSSGVKSIRISHLRANPSWFLSMVGPKIAGFDTDRFI
jgi:hypothetical protein